MSDKEIKAVIFDFGETLFTFGKVKKSFYFKKGARLSYDYLKSLGKPVGSFKIYCWRSLIELRLRLFISSITKNDFDAMSVLKNIADKKGIHLDSEEQYKKFVWLWYEPLSKAAQTEPDIKQTLQKLKDMGIKLGILSNTFVNGHCLEWHLKQENLLDFFDTRLYSYQFEKRKPAASIFKSAAEKINIPPENILFIGDRIDADIEGALNSNMQAVMKKAYTNKNKKPPRSAYVIEKLSEIPAIIEKNNGKIAPNS